MNCLLPACRKSHDSLEVLASALTLQCRKHRALQAHPLCLLQFLPVIQAFMNWQ